MAKVKKYYWLKLKSDFFDNLRMKKLRSIAGGDTYTIIYLKMQLLSLQEDGFLYYEGVEESFEQEIALLINENVEDVKITISFLLSNNLMREAETGKYELTETRTCIGSETDKAEFMRNLRAKREQEKIASSNNVTNALPNVTKCYTEKEIEKEIEKDIEIEKENIKEKAQKKHFADFVTMTNAEYDKLVSTYGKDFADQCITVLDNYKGANGKKYKSDYRAILNWVVDRVKSDNLKKKVQPSGNPFFDILREEGKM